MAKGSLHSHWVERLWLAAASVPNQQTSRTHWSQLLGEHFACASRWLAPTNGFACGIPGQCPSDPWLRIIEDEPFVYRAYDETRGQVLTIDRADVAVYGINWPRVSRSLCESAGFEYSPQLVDSKQTWLFAVDQPRMGFNFPVYLSFGPLLDRLIQICEQHERPFILLRLRPRPIDAVCSRLLNERRALLLTLSEATQPEGDHAIVFNSAAKDQVNKFRNLHVPSESVAPARTGFPTPAGCTWSNIKIRFLDFESVSITAGAVNARYHYSQMGMANRNNARRSVQWELLYAFAQGRGCLSWQSPDASPSNQKRRERLAKTLRQFFGIDSDPIRWIPEQGAWQTLFVIEA